MSLRKEVIRLAHSKPELREHLLPLIAEKTASGGKNVIANMVLDLMFEFFATSIKTSGSMMYINFKPTKELTSISAELNLKTFDLQIHAHSTSQSAVDTILKGRGEDLVLNLLKMSKSEASKRIQMYLKSLK